MKDKQRYILVETSGELSEDERAFSFALSKEIVRCVGEMRTHHINPKLTKIVDKRHFVIKSSLSGVNDLILALALIKRVNDRDMAFYTIKSSGTIRALLSSTTAKE